MSLRSWAATALTRGLVALASLLVFGCKQSESPTKEAPKRVRTASPVLPAEQASSLRPADETTTDGRAIFGGVELVSPTEVRVHVHSAFPGDRRASIRGTVRVRGLDQPAPLLQSPHMKYCSAILTKSVIPPVEVRIVLSARGYREAEITTTIATMSQAAASREESPRTISASSPKEYSELVELERARLGEAVKLGSFEFLPRGAQSLREAVEGLALTSKENVEMALQPALKKLDDVVTSLTRASREKSSEEAKACLDILDKIIDVEVRPYFVKE